MLKMSYRLNEIVILLMVILGCSNNLHAQFSLYGNTGYGYNQNPLYNYQKKPDQIRQSYLELNYLKELDNSSFTFSYVSGLMLFNEFQDRNFYEHNFYTKYNIRFAKVHTIHLSDGKPESEDSTAALQEEAIQDDSVQVDQEEESVEDSTDSYLSLAFQAGARHDKEVFREFDNFGTGLTLSYKMMMGDSYSLRLANSAVFRNYNNLSELSNVTDITSLQIANKYNGSFTYGILLTGGFKYYTQSIYDTTKFETKRSFNQKSQGKGKLGSKINVPSAKQILIQPQANGTSQFAAGLFFGQNWGSSSSLRADFLYRYNPRTQARYLAQYANTSMLSEDIYNDFFSYQGPETKLQLNQSLPFNIQMSIEYLFMHKLFEAPALNLEGVQTDNKKRNDIYNSADLSFSRSFNLFKGFEFNISLTTGIIRNQSNDDYNDFSSYHFSGAIGIGF